MILKTK